MEKIDIDNIALMLHNLSDYDGFYCWELDHIYKEFYFYRINDLLRDFKEVVQVLSKTQNMCEWLFTASVTDRFEYLESEKGSAFSYYLEASRSSMAVKYICQIEWPSDTIRITRLDLENSEYVKKESFELSKYTSNVNLSHFQRNSLFSNWFYRLFYDMKSEKLI